MERKWKVLSRIGKAKKAGFDCNVNNRKSWTWNGALCLWVGIIIMQVIFAKAKGFEGWSYQLVKFSRNRTFKRFPAEDSREDFRYLSQLISFYQSLSFSFGSIDAILRWCCFRNQPLTRKSTFDQFIVNLCSKIIFLAGCLKFNTIILV